MKMKKYERIHERKPKKGLNDWITAFKQYPELMYNIFSSINVDLQRILEEFNILKRKIISSKYRNILKNDDKLVEQIIDDLITEISSTTSERMQRSGRNTYSNETKKIKDTIFHSLIQGIINELEDFKEKEAKMVPELTFENYSRIVITGANKSLYSQYINIIENQISDLQKKKGNITKHSEIIISILSDLKKQVTNAEYANNFDLYKEIAYYESIIHFNETFISLIDMNLDFASKDQLLHKLVEEVSDYIFPRGSSVDEIFEKVVSHTDTFPLQYELISITSPQDSSLRKNKFPAITNNMRELFEKITEKLNTEPEYEDIGGDLYPGFYLYDILDIFVGNIASNFKKYTEDLLNKLGFIVTLTERDDEEIDEEAEQEELEEFEERLEDESEEEFEEEFDNELEDELDSESKEEKSGKKSGKKSKKSKKKKQDINPIHNKLVIFGDDLLELFENHGLMIVQEINDGENKQYIPIFNSETIFQFYLSNISFERKSGPTKVLNNKISGFFSILIYYLLVLVSIEKEFKEKNYESIDIESYFGLNPLLKIIGQPHYKLAYITRMKKIISHPSYLDLKDQEIDATKVLGRDIFQYLGALDEQLNSNIKELRNKLNTIDLIIK